MRNRAALVHRGTRDNVVVYMSPYLDENTRVVFLVQRRPQRARREGIGPGAGDYEVDALRVVLGTARVLGLVQRDDFVPQDVFARGDIGRNGDVPLAAGIAQLVRRPPTDGIGFRVVADVSLFGDLVELQLGFVDFLARTVAAGQIAHHRAIMLRRVGRPCQGDGVACLDSDGVIGVGGMHVTNDVGILVGTGIDGTGVVVFGDFPSHRVLQLILPHVGIVALITVDRC